MKVAIVGYGYVGKGFRKTFPDAVLYDPFVKAAEGTKKEVNACDLAIVCVPTNENPDGSADISIIEEVIGWIESPLILIKSAVPPGTVDFLIEKTSKRICVSPEYMGEGNYFTPPWQYPDPADATSHGFMVIGGAPQDCTEIIDIFVARMGPHTHFRSVQAIDAELIKYAENTWGATKVIFAHQLRDICEAIGADWSNVREGWADDPRVERMHTAVFGKKRGFGGKCYPKDLASLIDVAEKAGVDPKILKAVRDQNAIYRTRKEQEGG